MFYKRKDIFFKMFLIIFLYLNSYCYSFSYPKGQKKNNCTICYEKKSDKILHCRHTLCSSCLEKIRLENNKCPFCRVEIILLPTEQENIEAFQPPLLSEENSQKLMSLIRNSRKEEANLFIEQFGHNTTDQYGNSPLHIAAQNNQVNIAKNLIRMGANIDHQNSKGDTPLHYAYGYSYQNMIKLLIKKGSHTSLKNNKGNNPHEGFN